MRQIVAISRTFVTAYFRHFRHFQVLKSFEYPYLTIPKSSDDVATRFENISSASILVWLPDISDGSYHVKWESKFWRFFIFFVSEFSSKSCNESKHRSVEMSIVSSCLSHLDFLLEQLKSKWGSRSRIQPRNSKSKQLLSHSVLNFLMRF